MRPFSMESETSRWWQRRREEEGGGGRRREEEKEEGMEGFLTQSTGSFRNISSESASPFTDSFPGDSSAVNPLC